MSSEPLPGANYYPEPNPRNDDRILPDAYDDPLAPKGTFPDEPLDADPARPLGRDNLLATWSTFQYKTAFLQRLANPLLAWNPAPLLPDGASNPRHDPRRAVNPYIVVDWLPIDLTVFNGYDESPSGWNDDEPPGIGPFDPHDPEPPDPRLPPGERRQPWFSSRRRLNVTRNNQWERYADTATNAGSLSAERFDNYFPYRLFGTLGYFNTSNETLLRRGSPLTTYDGDLIHPFPWLTWNNRPYVNHFELMLVPSGSASHLFEEAQLAGGSPYSDAVFPVSFAQLTPFRVPFGHLLNFLHTSREPDKGAHFYRLFDWVEVPSRFVGTDRWYNPNQFESPSEGTTNFFAPPFTRMSRLRDPGRININTIFDERIWQGLYHPYLAKHTTWEDVALSRQGYEGPAMNAHYPTRFANPFRSAGSAGLMPRVADLRKPAAVEATLLRPKLKGERGDPLFLFGSESKHEDHTVNAFFYYQGFQRLGNLVTTHSNVFALWITVGYFEVDPVTQQLGPELDSDTGNVKRHRAFYIIDRSIPVAFEPGKNHNVDLAVVLRRFIE